MDLWRRYPLPKKAQKLPVVLSPEEVVHFLGCVDRGKHRVILTTCYAAGLRISEAVRLRAAAIDSARMVIRVNQGKGRKNRYVMLSPTLLEILRNYWKAARPKEFLFPGIHKDRPITKDAVEAACQKAHRLSGLSKPVTPHSLRHYLPYRTMSSSSDRDDKYLRKKKIFRRNARPPDIVSSIYRLFKNSSRLSPGRKRDDLPEYGIVFANAVSFIANVASR
jgi:integrase